MYVKIEGIPDALRWTKMAPENMRKLTYRAMLHSGSREARHLKSQIDSRWHGLVKFVVTEKGISGNYFNCGIGFFNNHQKKNPFKLSEVEDWYKAYWKNYGTLTRRDPSHHFKHPIKPDSTTAAKNRRNSKGQPYERFFDDAIKGYEHRYFNNFQDILARDVNDLYDR